MKRPKMFIGSSVEGLKIARAIHINLEREFEVTIWDKGIFLPSDSVLVKLVEVLNDFEFAVFIFSPDDVTKMRDVSVNSIRDNVIFETGLFMGKLGKEKVFFVKPSNLPLHLPTDLLGIISGEYDSQRTDENWESATITFCEKMKKAISNVKKKEKASQTVLINHEELLTVIENYLNNQLYKSITFKKLIENVDPLLTEDVVMEIIRKFPSRIIRYKLTNGQGIRILNSRKKIIENELEFLNGKWTNEHFVNNEKRIEDFEIKDGGKYYVDNEHWFNITNYTYDKIINRLKFTKTAIRVKDNRKLINDLTVESRDVLSGMEGNYLIKYIRKN